MTAPIIPGRLVQMRRTVTVSTPRGPERLPKGARYLLVSLDAGMARVQGPTGIRYIKRADVKVPDETPDLRAALLATTVALHEAGTGHTPHGDFDQCPNETCLTNAALLDPSSVGNILMKVEP